MAGEKSLEKLLKNISPELIDGEFVFCTFRFEKSQAGMTAELKPTASLIFTDEYSLDRL